MFTHAKRVLIGRPMRSDAAGHQLLSKRVALPVFASDALSSVAYAPDEILLTLALAGSLAALQSFWVGVAVSAVLAVVVLSYRQTVHAYPSGGGDYEVVTTNLGPTWGLLVASALLVDYVLTVAVSVSSGAHYLTTAVPWLDGHEVVIAVTLVAVLTVLNLRGTKEAGLAFAIPTYVYMLSIALMVVVGFVKMATGTLGAAPTAQYDLVPEATHAEGLVGLGGAFLLMRAFSSGCAALTGVEAISNGVPVFRRPKSRNAATTLGLLGSIAAAMMLSILVLARASGVKVVENPATQLVLNGKSVGDIDMDPAIGQIAKAVFGDGSVLFYLVTVVTGLILVLAANTAFNGFPTLASVLSHDSFLPRQLHERGDRLSYSNGILALAVAAGVLIVAFDAEVTRLIQLYVVGVFVSFTLSQLGMIRHWNRRLRTPQSGDERSAALRSRAVNVVGFMATALVLGVVLVTKFSHGAWITLLLMALVFVVQKLIRSHYDATAVQLRVEDWSAKRALPTRVRALVLVSGLSKPAMRAVATARAASPSSLELVSVVRDSSEEERIRTAWEASGLPLPLTLVSSPYRDVTGVVTQYVRDLRRSNPGEMLVVYVPEFLVRHWWENGLHNGTAAALRRSLVRIPGVVLTFVPWMLGEDDVVEGRQLVNDPFRPALQAPPRVKEDESR
ncbi:APC family permease [Schaalia sp. 19OD2882]|uniref:APC family permease n=1 Tax=Schaalia sp. 19OD2882 TaxID=2794089 RepID=UPI001C1EFBA9|nr:APC family permease [Schaalia sp. 19OD2882]QWW20649.1 APC family permease [Schaalia sp. 19OD2882]